MNRLIDHIHGIKWLLFALVLLLASGLISDTLFAGPQGVLFIIGLACGVIGMLLGTMPKPPDDD